MSISGPYSWVVKPTNEYFPMTLEHNGTAIVPVLMQVPHDASPRVYQLGFMFTIETATSVTQVSAIVDFSVSAPSSSSPNRLLKTFKAL